MRPRPGCLVVAGELGTVFVGATLPSPLYLLYQTGFGFGGITLTLIYVSFVLGNLMALVLGCRIGSAGAARCCPSGRSVIAAACKS